MAICREGKHEEAPDGVHFWERCIECLNLFAFNTDRTLMKVVHVPNIFMRAPFMRLKRRKPGPTVDLKEGRRKMTLARAAKAEERDEEEEETPLQERQEDDCPSEEEAGRTRLYIHS